MQHIVDGATVGGGTLVYDSTSNYECDGTNGDRIGDVISNGMGSEMC